MLADLVCANSRGGDILELSDSKNITVSDVMKSFMLTYRMHRALVKNSVDEFGISRSAHRILMFICNSKSQIHQRDIAEAFEISAAATANTLKKLESDGYIKRRASGKDNRFNDLHPTEKGRLLANSSKELFDNIDRALFSDFTERDKDVFIALNKRIQDNLKKIDPHSLMSKIDPEEE